MAPSASFSVPAAYAELGLQQIKVGNYPKDSKDAVTPIQILTLYRPGHYNAFTPQMADEITQAFGLFDVDDRVRCIIMTGDGRLFCAGADLDAGFSRGDNDRASEHRDNGGQVSLAIHNCRKPVIGALNGSAVGVGITMTLPMAIRLATKDAKIGFVFSRRGLIMEAASSFFLPRLIGHSRAMHLVTTASTYPASHELLAGIFSETLPDAETVMARAIELAEEFVNNCNVVAWALMRDLMWRGPMSAESTHLLDSRLIYEMFESRDNREGVQSFLEKRRANFTGTVSKDAPTAYPWWEPVSVAPRPQGGSKKSKL